MACFLEKKKRIEKNMGSRFGFSLLMAFVVAAAVGVRGQDEPSCATQLIPCQDYLNSTSPPATCCDPLKKTVATQLDCLCKLFENTAILSVLNISRTEALALPKHCGITSDISACSASPPSVNSTTGGGSGGASSSNNNNNGAGKIALIEISGMVGLLIFWVSMVG